MKKLLVCLVLLMLPLWAASASVTECEHYAICTNPGVCAACGHEDASLEGQHDPQYAADATRHFLNCQYCFQPQSEYENHVNLTFTYTDAQTHKMSCDMAMRRATGLNAWIAAKNII